ncbi:hypothetical protein CHS0354_006295 [Potamilus streckersoni]|uniref:Uncharacterized protein n=1 Tax=Potamilus streckersoni TaxID=2493646 RepID=A0AAE0S4Z8_9BIVA|nr:hypothetical protein CHS0354_006295 [Potamilus streckersoni]
MATFWGFSTVFTGIRIITLSKDAKEIPAYFYFLGFLIKTWTHVETLPESIDPAKHLHPKSQAATKDHAVDKTTETMLQAVLEPAEEKSGKIEEANNSLSSYSQALSTGNSTQDAENWEDTSQTSSAEEKKAKVRAWKIRD